MANNTNNATRSWVFTLNNPTDAEIEFFENVECKRIVVGDETGDNGTRHLQGFITWTRTYRLAALKKLSPRAHWQPAKAGDAANYCMKEKILINKGESEQGKRTDWEKLKEDIDAGASEQELRNSHFSLYMRYKRSIQEELSKKRAHIQRDENLVFTEPQINLEEHPVVALVGPSGIGKTQFALSHFENPLVVSHIDDLKNLENHDGIVFDDMDFCHWPVTAQIHLTDFDLPRSINVKYGVVTIPAGTKKMFTCNTNPFSPDHEAVVRRLHLVEFAHPLF